MNATSGRGFFLCLLCYLASLACPVRACSVPVFRYALENWPADPYRVIVFRRGGLSPEEQALVDFLQRQASGCEGNANLEVSTVDVAMPQEGAEGELWQACSEAQFPWMVVLCPGASARSEVVWAGPFTRENARALLDSPARREVARRIVTGESAVWVLLESGNVGQDAAAALLLDEELDKLERTLELSEPLDWPTDELFNAGEGPPLRVAFSVVSVSRSDPAERAFVNMLIHSEPDLDRYCSEPMAFPIFGRGRCLYALVGKGINAENIEEACAFLVGWCSCEAKWLNPGMDMLMSVDWEGMITGRWLTDELLPPLTGLSEFAEAAPVATQAGPATETDVAGDAAGGAASAEPRAGGDSGALLRNTLLAVLLVCAGVAGSTLMLKRKRR